MIAHRRTLGVGLAAALLTMVYGAGLATAGARLPSSRLAPPVRLDVSVQALLTGLPPQVAAGDLDAPIAMPPSGQASIGAVSDRSGVSSRAVSVSCASGSM
ncbi:hypothetical protein [Acidimicrobium ferrooxidans]|uniref:hypothetical protein n=1 Tax=Acidimicrobium ferrooxidans TaxID=53635 RepID=UPI00019DDEA8|nr:hypothetical protein [Acidimicrobium ferrooxidans]